MHYILMMLLSIAASVVVASENSSDSYLYREYCPVGQSVTFEKQTVTFPGGEVSDGWFNYVKTDSRGTWKDKSYFVDKWSFAQCNCTSYVAHSLNELWGTNLPLFSNGYYSRDRWGNAFEWYNAAIEVGIGVTGAKDNFVWDEDAHNAVFRNDVALWSVSRRKPVGHVAIVRDVQPGAYGLGVACVRLADYNLTRNDYRETDWVCRNTPEHDFPDYFLHIDRDHSICRDQPDNCPNFLFNGSGNTSGGVHGGSRPDPFNLKVNRFWVRDVASGTDLDPATSTVRVGQVIQPRIQVKAKDGDTHDHMRPGKNRIEVDLYARLDLGDWFFLKREYIQATNLPSGATHTEHIDYTVPPGVSTISFKAKIDAEDEAFESNEGDSWTEIQTFSVVNNVPGVPLGLTITVTN